MSEYGGERQTTGPHVPDPSHGHERSDVKTGPLLWIAAILVGSTLVVLAGLWLSMKSFEHDARFSDPLPAPLPEAHLAPPPPLLQPTMDYHPTLPFQDVNAMREMNAKIQNSYGWVNREKGIVRIPIEVAMQRLVERHSREGSHR